MDLTQIAMPRPIVFLHRKFRGAGAPRYGRPVPLHTGHIPMEPEL